MYGPSSSSKHLSSRGPMSTQGSFSTFLATPSPRTTGFVPSSAYLSTHCVFPHPCPDPASSVESCGSIYTYTFNHLYLGSAVLPSHRHEPRRTRENQIGRASCRER